MDDRYQRVLGELEHRSALSTGYIADPFLETAVLERGLARMRALLAELQHPDKQLRIIHVAGSKGKGSTATFLANILQDSGRRTGLTTSPHLHTFRERMAIDGQSISREAFGEVGTRALDAAARVERLRPELGRVSAFELLIAMSLSYFAGQACEFAVVEVGLGGRYDGTNVVSPLVSVITRLELEHTSILGNSLQEIAWNKGGIIKPGVPAVSSRQNPEAERVLQEIADALGAPLVLGGRDWLWQGRSGEFAFRMDEIEYDRLAIQLPGLPQVENAATSIAASLQAGLGGAPDAEIAIRSGLARTTLPGRFEVIEHEGRQIVLDGAHTLASTELLVEALEEAGIADPVVVAGFLSDKDMVGMATKLALVADRLIHTTVDSPRSATLEELTGISSEITGETAGVFPALEIAMGVALETAGPRQPIVVTGSMKLVAQAREWLCLVGKE